MNARHPAIDPLIIGLCGNAGVGKDTAADYLCSHHGFERFAFADPLRAMIEALLLECGQDYAYITERHLKEQPIPGLGLSYRHLAQTLGTEWGRALTPDLWLRTATLCLGLPDHPIHDRIVITDVRFGNEAEWVTQQQGVVARIYRPTQRVRAHISEIELDGIEPWAVIDNAGPIEQLHQQLDALVATLTQEVTP